jgi:hypothetical protein
VGCQAVEFSAEVLMETVRGRRSLKTATRSLRECEKRLRYVSAAEVLHGSEFRADIRHRVARTGRALAILHPDDAFAEY